MAIQRIERYGKFQPSPIDESRVRRMEQLAGLAGGIAQTARAFGEAKAAEEAPEKAQAAVEEAIKTDPETGEVAFGELPEAKGYGASATNKIALTLYNSSKEIYLDEQLNKFEAEHPNDLQSFTEKSQALLQELTSTSSLSSKTLLNKEYITKFKSATKRIQATIDKEVKEAGQATYAVLLNNLQTELTQAYESNDAEAEQEISVNFAESIKGLVENGIILPDQIITDSKKIEAKKNTLQYLGKLDAVYSDPDLDLRTREQAFNKLQDSFDADTANFSLEDKEKARKDLKSYKNNAIEKDKRDYVEAEITLESDQLDAKSELRAMISDPELTYNEKVQRIRQARYDGLSDANETILMNLLNSSKAIAAIDDEDFKDEILQLAHDLVTGLDGEPVLFLQGLNNVNNMVIQGEADGRLTAESAETVANQIQQLSRSRTALATTNFARRYEDLDNLMIEFYPNQPELRNTILREYFFEKALDIERENRDRIKAGEKALDPVELNKRLREFFIQRTQEIQEQKKNAALNLINTSANLFLMS